MAAPTFDVLLDSALSSVTTIDALKTAINKRILSITNDFEDGAWRYSKFQSYLWDNIALTALSERERLALVDQSHTTLVAAARNLRLTDKDEMGKGSEIAEVFLYGIMRQHFNALPVVPKIFYKQNSQDNAKGADSVHIVVDHDDFTLWFGEAKFYNSIADARLDSVVTSVYESLSTTKIKKENSIITNVSDLDLLSMDSDLRTRIKEALKPTESIDVIKPRLHVPIMLLHECGITAKQTLYDDAYKADIVAAHKERADAYFSRQMQKSSNVHLYDSIHFHIILFPVPNKKIIVDAFVDAVSFYKAQ